MLTCAGDDCSDLTETRWPGGSVVYSAGGPMSAQPAAASSRSAAARRRAVAEALTAYLWIAPAVLIIGAFHFLPVLYAAYISLHRWGLRQGPFVGLANY